MGRGSIDLSRVEVFVLDEVDRMFDMGFIKDVRRIVAAIPIERQTLLFSATISSQVKHFAQRLQTDSVLIEIGDQTNPVETVTQHVYPTARDRKLELLRTILENENMEMVLVFCGRKDHADFVTRRLQYYGIDAMQLHSNLAQRERQQALNGFKSGEHRVLVATDIAARGIDVEGISHVVNYDVPRFAEDYIHRIGRTGRAEAKGDAITFVGYEEEEYLRKIEEFIGQKFERKRYEDFDHGVIKLAPAKVTMRRRRPVGRRGRKR
jgi:ATP-dependent RNA helicase RhlE